LEQKFRKTLGTLGQKTYDSSYIFFFFSSLPAKRIKKTLLIPMSSHYAKKKKANAPHCRIIQPTGEQKMSLI
jgi:hypothetical protein